MIICPNCSSSKYEPSVGVCAPCGWQLEITDGLSNYFTDRDRESALIDDYVENYDELAIKNLKASNIDRTFLKNQAINLLKYIPPVKGLDVCDLGIGQGFLCDNLLASGVNSVCAIDVSSTYLKRFIAQEAVVPYLANAENLPFENEFDLVVSTDVMEHVINVGSFLYSVNRSLKAGGIAAIRVPYREGLIGYSPHMGYSHSFGHLRSFNKDVLKIYMEQAGFKVKSFHLDGFSTGTPHPYLYSTHKRKVWYNRLANFMNRKLKHPADATLLNPHLAKLVMRPVEIVVIVVKKTCL
jgi:SAM-dependent methyltransferase